MVLAWVTDRPDDDVEFMMLFEDAGHKGEYHEDPNETTSKRVLSQGSELPNILQRLKDTPLDYSGVIELSYVYERILAMIAALADEPRGSRQDAIDLYRRIGEAIRQKVFMETGHYPEEFPVPRGRITGNEKPSQFQLMDYQPPLM